MSAFVIFFFNDTATTEIYTLSLHDALPICDGLAGAGRTRDEQVRRLRQIQHVRHAFDVLPERHRQLRARLLDRKSTRLNSSHVEISYAVFCLKKKIFTGTTFIPIPFSFLLE